MKSNHNLQTILVISTTASLAYMVAILSIDQGISAINFGPHIILAVLFLGASTLLTVSSACDLKKNLTEKCLKFAVISFLIGFLWIIALTIFVALINYLYFGEPTEKIVLCISIIIAFVMGLILASFLKTNKN